MQAVDFIGNMDISKTTFAKVERDSSGTPSVKILHESCGKECKLMFQLTPDTDCPFPCMWQLDRRRDDTDGSRRGASVIIQHELVAAKLHELDELIIATAIEKWGEWFPKSKPLKEEEIRARYSKIMCVASSSAVEYIKFKVKFEPSRFPTKLHLNMGNDSVKANGGRIEHLEMRGASVVPILSVFSVWFMGGGLSFGVSMQAEQMLITPGSPPDELGGFVMKKRPRVVMDDDAHDNVHRDNVHEDITATMYEDAM